MHGPELHINLLEPQPPNLVTLYVLAHYVRQGSQSEQRLRCERIAFILVQK